jgi:hypothetical protein
MADGKRSFDMLDALSRREALKCGGAMGALLLLDATACGKDTPRLSCSDTSALSRVAAQQRVSLAYVDATANPTRCCRLCQQFIPAPVAGKCGSCKVLQGTINPNGYCKVFSAKPT